MIQRNTEAQCSVVISDQPISVPCSRRVPPRAPPGRTALSARGPCSPGLLVRGSRPGPARENGKREVYMERVQAALGDPRSAD